LDTISTQLEDCLNLSQGYISVQKGISEDIEANTTNTEEVESEEDE